jgi:hypothetical protein
LEEQVDPVGVQTLPELVEAFNLLRGGHSYSELNRAARPRLAPSTLSNLLHGTSIPTRETVVVFLGACGLREDQQHSWLAAWERVATAHLRRPPDGVRVRDAQPRLLGVHAAIKDPAAAGELPLYVPRDIDTDLADRLAAGAKGGSFLLLVGGSSVGKTRTLHEAVKAAVPEWWLVRPESTARLREMAGGATERTVVWLDELQKYLAPDHCLAGSVRALLRVGTVLVGTLWPHEYTGRVVRPPAGEPDPHADDRELLDLAEVFWVGDSLTAEERCRAEDRAGADPRIRTALDTPDAGFTQVLAAGPELVAWWETAHHPYGKAVITAALDARRVGATAALSRELLVAAAPAYLTPADQATAPPDWADRALEYATTHLKGAASALSPVPAGMGRVAGYTVADYLHQHGRRVRRTVPLPPQMWRALVDHHHLDDTWRLADSAERRGQRNVARTLFRLAADNGDWRAAEWLAVDLINDGRADEAAALLRPHLGQPGDQGVAIVLARWLIDRGRSEEAAGVLRERAEFGDPYVNAMLANLLVAVGHAEELRERADAGDEFAQGRLARLLAEQGRIEELRQRASAGEPAGALWLAGLLVREGGADEAIALLRRHADGGDALLANRLAGLLVQHDYIDELRQRTDDGDPYAADKLAGWLAMCGDLEMRLAAMAPEVPAGLIHTDELRRRADAGDGYAARALAELLAEHGHTGELRRRAETGDVRAAYRLACWYAEHDEPEAALAVVDRDFATADSAGAVALAKLLTALDRIDEAIVVLRMPAEARIDMAAQRLAQLLAKQGNAEELRNRANAGDLFATNELAELLTDQGNTEELRKRADAGELSAAMALTGLLADQGRVEELRAEVHAGTHGAVGRFAELTRAETDRT